jgi:putative ABC transport system substrate-binding protein
MIARYLFIALAGLALGWDRTPQARAQQKPPTIALLALGNPDPSYWRRTVTAGLADLGYVAGKNIVLRFHSAEGSAEHLRRLAGDLVRDKVDIILTYQTPAAIAAKIATSIIPIVMAPAGDPVGTGLVASLARPGGNVTGLSGVNADVVGKNLEIVREIVPSIRRITVCANGADPFHKPFLTQLGNAARMLAIDLTVHVVNGADETDAAIRAAAMSQTQAIIIQPSLSRRRAAALALDLRLPSISPTRPFTEEGGLLSYSASNEDLFRKSAYYVDRLLKGAKPADLPIQQPTKFELAINLKTAKALGVTVPATLLARADEVIE